MLAAMRRSATVVAVALLVIAAVGPPRAAAREYYEVRRAELGGVWNWSLAFDRAPYKFNNYINEAAAVASRITGGNYSSIVAGSANWIDADFATIGGGSMNSVVGQFSSIRGGIRNTARGSYASLAGGAVNKVHSNYGTVLGGYKNLVMGRFGTVLGGAQNTVAGRYSVAAGFQAKATHDYSAVFSFAKGQMCKSAGVGSVRFCANYVSFGDGDDPLDLLKTLAAVDKARRLALYDDVEVSLARSRSALADLDARVEEQGRLLDTVMASL